MISQNRRAEQVNSRIKEIDRNTLKWTYAEGESQNKDCILLTLAFWTSCQGWSLGRFVRSESSIRVIESIAASERSCSVKWIIIWSISLQSQWLCCATKKSKSLTLWVRKIGKGRKECVYNLQLHLCLQCFCLIFEDTPVLKIQMICQFLKNED